MKLACHACALVTPALRQCPCGGQLLCARCDQDCPFCGEPASHECNQIIKALCLALKVHCTNAKCAHVSTLAEITQHELHCPFKQVRTACDFCLQPAPDHHVCHSEIVSCAKHSALVATTPSDCLCEVCN